MRLWGIYSGGKTEVTAETCRHVAVGPCKQPEWRTCWWDTGAARGSRGANSRLAAGTAPALRRLV